MFRRSLVQVWSLEEPDWTCKIDEGSAGTPVLCPLAPPRSPNMLHPALPFSCCITSYVLYVSPTCVPHPISSTCLYFPLQGAAGTGIITDDRALRADWLAAAEGLDGVRWAPDGRHILTWANFQLRITVWSLVSQHTCYIKLPKYSVRGE